MAETTNTPRPAAAPLQGTPLNPDFVLMTASYDGFCAACSEPITRGETCYWGREVGIAHPTCVVMLSPEEAAQRLALQREAEQVRAKAQRAEAKARREERAALLLATPIERYGGGLDSRNSEPCSRCGGTGMMPFSVYQGICFKCNGGARALKAQVPQPRLPKGVKLTPLHEAVVGDYVADKGGTRYQVTGIIWRKPTFKSGGNNQRLLLRRLIDDEPAHLARAAVQPLPPAERAAQARGEMYYETLVPVSRAMHDQPATRDAATGAWVVWGWETETETDTAETEAAAEQAEEGEEIR